MTARRADQQIILQGVHRREKRVYVSVYASIKKPAQAGKHLHPSTSSRRPYLDAIVYARRHHRIDRLDIRHMTVCPRRRTTRTSTGIG